MQKATVGQQSSEGNLGCTGTPCACALSGHTLRIFLPHLEHVHTHMAHLASYADHPLVTTPLQVTP